MLRDSERSSIVRVSSSICAEGCNTPCVCTNQENAASRRTYKQEPYCATKRCFTRIHSKCDGTTLNMSAWVEQQLAMYKTYS